MRNVRAPVFVVCTFAVVLLLSPLVAATQGEITLPAGEDAVVLTLNLDQGDLADFSWSAVASVEFRIQNLADTILYLNQFGQVGSGTFEAPTDGAYMFEFRNANDFTVTVQWTIDRLTPPSSPQSLQAIGGDAEVDLSWQAPSFDGGSPVTGYRIYRGTTSGDLAFLVEVGDVVAHTDAAVTNGVVYHYEVSAVNTVGEGLHSDEVSATPLTVFPLLLALLILGLAVVVLVAMVFLARRRRRPSE